MKIIFIKDHCEYRAGEVVGDHPNAEYLITVGVAEKAKDTSKKKKEEA